MHNIYNIYNQLLLLKFLKTSCDISKSKKPQTIMLQYIPNSQYGGFVIAERI